MKNEAIEVSLSRVFFRMLIGFFSGLAGTMILGIVLFVAWGVVGDTIQSITFSPSDSLNPAFENTEVHPLFLNFITLAIFLAALAGTLCYGTMICKSEDKEDKMTTTLTHIFIGNLVILVMILPLYYATSGMEAKIGIMLSTIVHSIMAVLYTAMVMEILQDQRHLMVNLFGVIFGIILFCWISTFVINNFSIFIFLTLPLLLSMVSAGATLVMMFYNWIIKIYGEDFMDVEKKYGKDYKKEKEDESILDYNDI